MRSGWSSTLPPVKNRKPGLLSIVLTFQEEKHGGHILKVSTHSTPPPVYTTNDLLVPAKTPPIVNDRPSVNAGGYNNPIFKEIDFVPQIPDPLAANVGLSPTPTSRTKKLGGEVLDMDYLKVRMMWHHYIITKNWFTGQKVSFEVVVDNEVFNVFNSFSTID